MSNAGFESGLVDWTTFTGSETITSDAFAGANALALSANRSGVDQGFSVVAGGTYSLSAYGKTSGEGWSGIGLRFYDNQWNQLEAASTRITSQDWQEYTLDAIAPTGSVRGILWAWKGDETGTTTLDELGVSTDSTPPPPPSGERLTNASFESGITNWNAFAGTEAIATDMVIDGAQSLQLSANGSGVSQAVAVTAGATYQLSGFAKTSSTAWSGFGLDFWDSNWNRITGSSERITTADWAVYEADYVAPTNAAHATTWIWKGGNDGSTYWDGVSLQQASEPTNQPPIITSNGGTDSASLTVAENGTGAIANINSSDPDGDTEGNGLTYSLQGPDISQISINPNTGQLSFNNAPDFENPTDNNGDNQYEVAVVVADSQGATDTQSLSITVTDVDETPADTTAPSAGFTDAYVTISGATSYEFDIDFSDNIAIDVSTLDNNDIRVVGPNGFSQVAQWVSVNPSTDGPFHTATYRITPPGGSWDSADNGIYSVELLANQVGDTSGNLVNAATLGNIDVTLEGRITLGNLNEGIAARDGATGIGYLMYSEELLPVRFINNPPYSSSTYGDNANNLIAVVLQNDQWYYDDNSDLRPFTPRSTDLLLAELNFSTDTATLLQGQNRLINGIRAGYESGDLTVTPNVWNGSTGGIAPGEFGVTGIYVTVSDDGTFEGQLSLVSPTVDIDEDAGILSVTVTRTDGSDGRVTVDYATSGVSATSGQDFTSTSGTLVFEDGQTSRVIQIPIINDTDSEEDETFVVNLSNPTGGASLGNSGTAVTILNDDAPPTPGNPGDLLPDLVPISSTLTEALRIDTTTLSGRTILRLSTEVANAGEGPLEIWGGSASGDSQPVFQRIYNDTGGSRDVLAGEFVYHPSHGHIHFEGFATYSLRQVSAGNGVGSIIASGGKTSFCLINIRQPFPELTHSAQVWDGRGGNNCGQIQGIDLGYSDVYNANLPDQWIDVTNVSDGTYWLEAIADPDDNMLELDETNNVARVQITLSNGQVFA